MVQYEILPWHGRVEALLPTPRVLMGLVEEITLQLLRERQGRVAGVMRARAAGGRLCSLVAARAQELDREEERDARSQGGLQQRG